MNIGVSLSMDCYSELELEQRRQADRFSELCSSGDLDGAKLMVEKIPDVSTWRGIRHASDKGYFHILKWWRQMVIEKRITDDGGFDGLYSNALMRASMIGNINVLEWWHQNSKKAISNSNDDTNFELKFNGEEFHVKDDTGLELRFDCQELTWVSMNGHVNILEWWYEKRHIYSIEFNKISKRSIERAIANGHTNVLDWSTRMGFEIKYSDESLLDASNNGHDDILNWLFVKSQSMNQFRDILQKAVSGAMIGGRVNVLNWWKSMVIGSDDFNYPTGDYFYILYYGYADVLEWLMKHDKTASQNITEAVKNMGLSTIKCVEWLIKNGFLDKPIYEKILELYEKEEYDEIINKFYL